MAPITRPRQRPIRLTPSQLRDAWQKIWVLLIALGAAMAFLMPLGYMGTTAFKTLQQIIDPHSVLLPSSPMTYNYQGKDYTLYQVPMEQGIKTLALVEPGREESGMVDPANPAAGVFVWVGRWRTLEPFYEINPTLDNFPRAWDQINFPRLFRNTLFISLSSTLGAVVSSIFVAYGFARFRFRGKSTLFLILMATIILPTQVTLIPQYIFFRSIGWGGTWWPLIVPHFFANAYNVFLLRQYFRGIPRDLDEAATIDGANPLRVMFSVIIPQSWPAITAVSLFHFFWSWNDFFTPLVYLQGNPELYPISVGLTEFNNAFTTQPGLAMAAAMMTLALPAVLFFTAQRAFMQGIVITGVEK
ncbi:Diacetylchitobiose uptake system permease protein NgcG [Anaerolineae bacterium]|nr:Diacetylchitobiose uptake system permease protein NgcG [Anaerolineae bacterium]